MNAVPYLNFDGDCAEAFRFYGELFGGRPEIMTFGGSPVADEMPPGTEELVLHACLRAGDLMLMASDVITDRYKRPQGLWVSLHVEDGDRADALFAALGEGGTVVMPIEKTFWAERFGMVVDRFGTPWMINCAPPPGE